MRYSIIDLIRISALEDVVIDYIVNLNPTFDWIGWMKGKPTLEGSVWTQKLNLLHEGPSSVLLVAGQFRGSVRSKEAHLIRAYETAVDTLALDPRNVGEVISKFWPESTKPHTFLSNAVGKDRWEQPFQFLALAAALDGGEVSANGDRKVRVHYGDAVFEINEYGAWSNTRRQWVYGPPTTYRLQPLHLMGTENCRRKLFIAMWEHCQGRHEASTAMTLLMYADAQAKVDALRFKEKLRVAQERALAGYKLALSTIEQIRLVVSRRQKGLRLLVHDLVSIGGVASYRAAEAILGRKSSETANFNTAEDAELWPEMFLDIVNERHPMLGQEMA